MTCREMVKVEVVEGVEEEKRVELEESVEVE